MSPRVDWNLVWHPGGPRFLLADCKSGLGNRIKTLVSAMRAMKRMPGRLLAVLWPLDGYHLHCSLHELFENPFLVVTPEFFSGTGYIDHHYIRQDRPNFVNPELDVDVIWVTEENFWYVLGDQKVIWGQHGPHGMANATIRDELLAEFDRLVPHPIVRYAAENFYHRYLAGRPVVGVHIRQGDNVWARHFVPPTMFPDAVREILRGRPSDTRLFLCTDSAEAQTLMERHFPSRIVTFPRRASPLERGQLPVVVQDALAEMYLLARTDLIVRTPSSTFSQCASWLGRVSTVEVGPLEHYW